MKLWVVQPGYAYEGYDTVDSVWDSEEKAVDRRSMILSTRYTLVDVFVDIVEVTLNDS